MPLVKLALHVGAQLIPVGALATVPDPVPVKFTVSTAGFGTVLKLAVTCSFAARVNVQVGLVPVQLPEVHPAKVELVPAVAVSVT